MIRERLTSLNGGFAPNPGKQRISLRGYQVRLRKEPVLINENYSEPSQVETCSFFISSSSNQRMVTVLDSV